jgi:Mrp family chromosome partitioning ATPase
LVSDASVLASRVDGVLLVICPGKTQIDSALFSLEQMKRAGANILGVVMNRHSRHQSYYYRYYRYNNHYYDGNYGYYGEHRKNSSKVQFSKWMNNFNRNGSEKDSASEPNNEQE